MSVIHCGFVINAESGKALAIFKSLTETRDGHIVIVFILIDDREDDALSFSGEVGISIDIDHAALSYPRKSPACLFSRALFLSRCGGICGENFKTACLALCRNGV